MTISVSTPGVKKLAVQEYQQESDRTFSGPILWVDSTKGLEDLAQHFQLKQPGDTPGSGKHIIALQSERDIRRTARSIQQEDILGVIPPLTLTRSVPEMVMAATRQPFDRWKKTISQEPLSLEEALEIAGDTLTSFKARKISAKQKNIELEELRQRSGMSSFDWNRFIQDLEQEIHATVDGKAADPDERLKLELKSLLKEPDKTKYIRKRAEIASHYRLTKDEIKELLRDLDEHAKTKEPRCMGLDELFSLPNTTVEYVIPGMLPAGETIILSASPKTGKSLLAYDAAFAVATGEDTFLGETCKQGKVLIIQCDESPNTASARLTKRGFRPEDAPNVKFVDSFNISQLDKLEDWLESFRPSLVLIDCLRRISSSRSISENSAEFADSVYQLKELIARYNAAGILIHHSNKNPEAVGVERVRGSSAIAGAVWGVWQLDHILKPDPNNKKRKIIDPKDPTRILNIIARDIEGERLRIELDPNKNRWINLGQEGSDESQVQERKTHEQRILGLLKSVTPTGLEGVEIKQELGLGQEVYGYLNRLLGKRLIGTRPSTRDRRSTVYFYPQPEPDTTLQIDRKNRSQGGGSGVNHFENTPPSLSPTPTVQDAINSSESYTQQDLQNRSQIDRKIDRKPSEESLVCNSNQATSLDVSMTAPKNGNGLNLSKSNDAPLPAEKLQSSPSTTQSSQTEVTTGSLPTALVPSQRQNSGSLNEDVELGQWARILDLGDHRSGRLVKIIDLANQHGLYMASEKGSPEFKLPGVPFYGSLFRNQFELLTKQEVCRLGLV